MAPTSEITLRAQCHCGLASYSYDIPSSAIPLKSALCHCNICRQVSGHLFATFAVIPCANRPDVSKLTAYASSTSYTRFFCPRCGASVANFEPDEWEFASGMLESTEGLLNRVQLFIEDARDGGAAIWLGRGLPEMHIRARQSELVNDAQVAEMSRSSRERVDGAAADTVDAQCHCGDVSFTISKGEGKYSAGLDACTSCRKASGFEITSWITVPKKSISMTGGALDLSASTMKEYQTSEKVHRYFCRRCGATIFYIKDDRDTIDVGVGLLRAGTGARAEEFLAWEKYDDCVAYQEDAADPLLVRALMEEIQNLREG